MIRTINNIIDWLFSPIASLFMKKPNLVSSAFKDSGTVADPNVRAFLYMVRMTEGTQKKANPYAVVMGYGKTITDFSNHPYFTGEWMGAKFSGGFSTAAGAYQFLRNTWSNVRASLGLKDFGPESQDKAAIQLIRGRNAYSDVVAGRVKSAIAKCNKEWASLAGSPYGQTTYNLSRCVGFYTDAGGVVND